MKLENLCVKYGENVIFEGFNFDIKDGEILCVLGRSGCGKTTLLRAISGQVKYDGKIYDLPNKISYIFQQSRLIDNINIQQNLQFVISEKDKEKSLEKINIALDRMKLGGYNNRFPYSLSGGEKSRVSLARAYCYGGDFMLMDEPFKALDIGLKYEIIQDFITAWQTSPIGVVMVTHDIDEALMIGDKIVVLGGTKPTKIVYECNIDIPRNGRKVGDKELASVRQKIFDALCEQQ